MEFLDDTSYIFLIPVLIFPIIIFFFWQHRKKVEVKVREQFPLAKSIEIRYTLFAPSLPSDQNAKYKITVFDEDGREYKLRATVDFFGKVFISSSDK